MMRDERVSGIILSPTQKSSNNFLGITNSHLPVVVIDRRVHGVEIDNVQIDNVESAYKIIDPLVGHGYQRIGALFGMGSTTGRERREGYITAIEDSGVYTQMGANPP
jgi:DNA-binding LacI/PurR family transcriptional regulator